MTLPMALRRNLARIAAAVLLLVGGAPAFAADNAAITRGAYLAIAAGCGSCHTDKKAGGAPLAGGPALKTDFGTFYGPNITPDKQTGIGNWTEDQFKRALHQGVAPGGRHLYPAFPYFYFTLLSRTDTDALFADLVEVLSAPGLPAPVKAAIGQLLALPTVFTAPLTAETIRQAVAQSGLFLEAHMREGEADQPDLKAALLNLQRALASAPSAEAPRTTRPLATPPPVREAGLTPQAAARPTVSAQDQAPVIVQHLAREVDQAVARQTLHQLASLPDGQAPSWLFELPVATPQGAAVAQFEIDRDGRQSGATDGSQAWRVRFSLDIEPLGPVHVHLRLDGERTGVTVWAERAEGLERLRGLGSELSRALPAEVIFHPGSPRRPLPENGQFVDRAL
mgnify:CR=1 FL=1